MLITESVDRQLDDLLERVGEKLQLSDSAYAQAEARYLAIGKWLGAEGSVLASYRPTIYTQGSVRIGTTVRPRGSCEYDIDLVCELQIDWNQISNPVEVLNLVESRLREHSEYQRMLERKNRCLRVKYANEFHLDILLACPNAEAGTFCVVVPGRSAKTWKHSNPRGYAKWFESTAAERQTEFRKAIEPVPEQESVTDLAPLKRAVQLMKRNRDILFQTHILTRAVGLGESKAREALPKLKPVFFDEPAEKFIPFHLLPAGSSVSDQAHYRGSAVVRSAAN